MRTAKQSREIAKSNIESSSKKELELIEGKISAAIEKGEFELWIDFSISKETRSHLNSLGYSVKESSDQRDGDAVKISW